MIDRDGDENYQPLRRPARGRLSGAACRGSVRRPPLEPPRSRPRHGDRVLQRRVPRGGDELRATASTSGAGEVETIGQSAYGAYVAAWSADHARVVPRRRLHGRRHRPLRARRERRSNASCSARRSTSVTEGEELPAHGLRRLRMPRRAATGSCSRRLSSTTRAVRDISRSTAPARSSPSRSTGSCIEARGELEGVRHLEGRRYAVTYNIDGCSWIYEAGSTRPRGRSRSSGCSSARASSRAACTTGSTTTRGAAPTRSPSAPRPTRPSSTCSRSAAAAGAAHTRARARACARAPLGRRGRVVQVARRASRLGAPLPPLARARVRRSEAARVLRPRRPAEPGAAQLRLVLDAADPDPHARGLRRVRARTRAARGATGSTT